MSKSVAVVTGASSGIGKELALTLAEVGVSVVAVARNKGKLEALEKQMPNVTAIAADLSTAEGRTLLQRSMDQEDMRVQYLAHSVGTVEPVARLDKVDLVDWRKSQATNLEAPLFTTIELLPYFHECRVLFVGSASASRARSGWSAYCCAKSALFMAYQCLKQEWAGMPIAISNAKPGPVDTAIFELGMSADEDIFPDKALFRKLQSTGQIASAYTVGQFLKWLLLECSEEEFTSNDWDIRDTTHHRHWLDGDLYAKSVI